MLEILLHHVDSVIIIFIIEKIIFYYTVYHWKVLLNYNLIISCLTTVWQELTEDFGVEASFHDAKFLSKDGKPKELFLSSDANAVVEHTKQVLVIEDGEVVHLKVLPFFGCITCKFQARVVLLLAKCASLSF